MTRGARGDTGALPWFETKPRISRSSRSGYIRFVALSGILAAAQILILPRRLDETSFGITVLAISVTQGVLVLGDVGLTLFASDTTRNQDERRALRSLVMTTATAFSLGVCTIFLVLAMTWPSQRELWLCLALGAGTGWVLWPRAAKSLSATASGDEVETLHNNLLWQNAPKPGLILSALVFPSAVVALAAGWLTSLLAGRMVLPHRPMRPAVWPPAGAWVVAFGIPAFSFGLMWADSYVLAATATLDDVGQYQVIYRALWAVTYLYLPLLALAGTAFNAGDRRRWRRILVLAAIGTVAFTAAAAFALVRFGHRVWPTYSFDPQVAWLLAAAGVLAFGSAASGSFLIMVGQRVSVLLANVVGLIAVVVVSLALIPAMGSAGAAIGSVTGYALTSLLQTAMALTVRRARTHEPRPRRMAS